MEKIINAINKDSVLSINTSENTYTWIPVIERAIEIKYEAIKFINRLGTRTEKTKEVEFK